MTLLWAHSVRPYTHFSNLAPKERQSPGQGAPPWASLLCVSVVKEGKNFSVSLW
jgi:hypothetical protein